MSNRLGGFIAGQNINVSIGTFTTGVSPDLTFASTQATPAVGQPVQFTTTGTLPTGFSLNTTYYVRSVSSNTCQVSTTQGGSATTYTNGTGSGTHTAVTQRAFNPYAGAPDTVEYLVVAGGAGGQGARANDRGGGGGGGGGLLTANGFNVAVGSALTITVGAGGTGATAANDFGTIGGNSVFSSITTIGGQAWSYTGVPGGSGSGGSAIGGIPVTGGAGTSGQGNNGGDGSSNNLAGGGGGGAGSVGNLGVSGAPSGNGGTGLCSTITGQRVFYAGGGGGCNVYNQGATAWGLGGAGGGGNGQSQAGGLTGTANTGGGGGAGDAKGGAGGSGVVIVRYSQINSPPALVTGSPQVSYSDGYQIYTWTSSGSIIF